MERQLYLEQLDRLGRVRHRTGIDRLPFTIGRAYDNDLIVDDPYVSLSHCRLESSKSGVVRVIDQESDNGCIALPSRNKVGTLELGDSDSFRIGHTIFRVRSASYADLPATRAIGISFGASNMMHSAWLAVASLLLLTVYMGIKTHMSGYNEFNWIKYIFGEATPALIVITVIAGMWALFTRLLDQHFNFVPHILILTLLTFTLDGLSNTITLASYMLSLEHLTVITVTILMMLSVVSVWFYFHLHFATHLPAKTKSMISAFVAITIVTIGYQGDVVKLYHYDRNGTTLSSNLYPAGWQLTSGQGLEDYIEQTKSLKEEADHYAQKALKEEDETENKL